MIDAHAEARRAREACGQAEGDDGNFWLDERPFIMTVGPAYPEQLSEVSHGLPSILGWTPEQVVTFAAMCNDDRDHRLLARLCVALSEAVGARPRVGRSSRLPNDQVVSDAEHRPHKIGRLSSALEVVHLPQIGLVSIA
jgi:hypothetical protein